MNKRPFLNAYKSKLKDAKRRGLEIKLTYEEFVVIKRGRCVYCKRDGHMTLERRDNSIGYVNGNVDSACLRCNNFRNDSLTREEMIMAGSYINKIDDIVLNAKRRYGSLNPRVNKHI